MDKKTEIEIKEALERKKTNLESELSRFAKKDKDIEGDWDTKYPRTKEGDLEDAADEVEQYSTMLPIEFSLEKQLQEVKGALERIKKGSYGICETCGKQIEKEKLLAYPETRICLSCQGDA
ncbi:MAG: TraR/DksA C4-type zinc finger protein [bacterium]|nr:TraR/DksA C4-type zinc finger protein [bacterium]MDZ4231753.1 TraR/DksA C4-type zinc finger protein [Candidatus Pacearchaeota archaeon]